MHPLKAFLGINSTEGGIDILSINEHCPKAESLIDLNEDGISI